ncbi:AMP-binding protein [Xenorhabdus bovienii]|uniref:phenylacetate--CoA ligase family protein n=1 Tax=Xenorhabdus bovienii TaxID=40576 RepID=UPI00237C65EB|nr:AMP-binding protein [Xenorhabdus bovienii]MDE1485893.1 AMP-binding protein [Xenorhabdus bovienii]MDE9476688.1 AMP-binding protein [Xenorhabdus bovienii]MDE9529479.1 AMP-binding protein [Xenorhabdus bovienii]
MNTKKLKLIIEYAFRREFYQSYWEINISDIHHLIDEGLFHTLPLTRKSDIRDHWNRLIEYGDATDFVSSSGTTGRPVDIPVHRLQEQIWVDSVARVLRELGAKQGDRMIQLLSNNDMFTLGPLVWQAAKNIGVGVFRCSPQRSNRILSIMEHHNPQFIVGNPLVLIDIAESLGNTFPDKNMLPKYAYLGACASFDSNNNLTATSQKVKDIWGFEEMLNEYGCSEIGSIGHECTYHNGFHINDDYVYVELIDPETGKPAEKGHSGEVVVTTLTQPRGFAAVRYATGDIASWLDHSPCHCGRSGARLGAIVGRVDHQLKVKGQTIYPELILNIAEKSGLASNTIVVRYKDDLDREQSELWVEPKEGLNCSDDSIANHIIDALQTHIAVSPTVRVVNKGIIDSLKSTALSRSNGVKIPQLIDISHPEEYI